MHSSSQTQLLLSSTNLIQLLYTAGLVIISVIKAAASYFVTDVLKHSFSQNIRIFIHGFLISKLLF